jgi:MFS family permease
MAHRPASTVWICSVRDLQSPLASRADNDNRTVGSSIYSPAASDIVAQFHVSNTVALLGVSLYVLGLGFGPVLAAPISETYGRMVVYRVSLPLSMLFTLGAGFSQSFASLLVCRFFAGLLGSPVLSVGAGTNADLFPPKTRANATIAFLLAPFLGTSVG